MSASEGSGPNFRPKPACDTVSDVSGVKSWVRAEYPELVQLGQLVRYELQTARSVASGLLSARERARLRSLRERKDLKLHVACGDRILPGWLNVDASPSADVRLDLRKSLPFSDGSAALVFTEHFLDHLQFPQRVERVLGEFHRVLAPGGRLRLVVHDAERLARAYLDRDAEFFRLAMGGQPPFIEGVNQIFRFSGFHQFIYDFEMMDALLRRVGFRDVIRSSYRASQVDALNVDSDVPDRAIQSLYVEAVR
jgi:predicted SAM-dependent methyltransferase